MVRIGSNISSLQAQRRLGESTSALGSVYEKLASGQRINKAADDAAGLAIAETLRSDARVFTTAIRNLNDGISYVSIYDGALQELTSIMIRQKELAEQSANGIFSSTQRASLKGEADQLTEEFNRILDVSKFNGVSLFNSGATEIRFQAGYGVEGSLALELGQSSGGSMATGTGTFAAAVTVYGGSSDGVAILAEDFNNDNILDIAKLSGTAGDFGIYFGAGDGTFVYGGVQWPSSDFSQTFAAADFNGDDNIDMVTRFNTFFAVDHVGVALGNGDGTFAAPQYFITTQDATPAVAAGDINGDGDMDVVAAGVSAINIFYGNGDGTLQAVVSFGSIPGIEVISIADLDGNGYADILTNGTAAFSVLMNNGDGTFAASMSFASSGNLEYVTTADLNGDSVLDVVTTDRTNSQVSVYIGNGNGSFGAYQNFSTGDEPQSVVPGDLNGDGFVDLVVATEGALAFDHIQILRGNGDGTFAAAVSYTRAQTNVGFPGTVVEDFNGDGVLDIVNASGSEGGLTFHMGESTGQAVESSALSLRHVGIDLSSVQGSRAALDSIDIKLGELATERGKIGAFQGRLEVAISVLSVSRENYLSAESRIRDVDVAKESSDLSRLSILQQAASSVLSQANLQPQLALTLLR